VLEALGRLCRGPAGPLVIDQLQQWAPTWLVQLSGVLEAAAQARLLRHTQGTTRARLLRELAEALEALTQTQLGVLVLEDLHWSDPSTVEVLTMLARRRETARLVVLGTYRPVELILRAHPLKPAIAELHLHGHCTELALPYLEEAAVAAYVAHRFPAAVAQAVAPVIYRRTAGHPLFMVHLAAYLAQQVEQAASAGVELAARVAATAEAIPTGVQQLIELQLGQLHAEEQRVLEMASVVGVEFAVASVAAGLGAPLDLPEAVCEALAHRGQFLEACGLAVWPDGTVSGQYRFRHAMYQQVLYRRLAATRRVQGHRRIGVRLEAGYATQTGEIEAVLAVHFERCHDYGRALQYLLRATENATRKNTPHEVIVLATKGMELLDMLPETPAHLLQELDLQVAIGRALMATKGYANADVERVYARAWELCRRVGETPQLFPTLFGLWRFYNAQPQLHTARELAETLLNLAQQAHNPTLVLPARHALGIPEFYLGNFSLSRQHMEAGIACDAPDQHAVQVFHLGQNLGVTCRAYAAWTLGLLGYPAQAQVLLHEAMVLADELAHPFSLVSVQCMATFLYQLRREVSVVYEQAEKAIALATTQGFALFTAFGMSSRGWALAMQGQVEEGLAQIHQGLSTYRATGAALGIPYFCTMLAYVCAHSGHSTAGLQALAEAHTLMEQHEERWLEAEIYRLRGILLLQQSETSQEEAEAWLQRALDVARFQQAKALELRAAMSLSHLWQCRGKCAAARALLEPLYDWFTEGFDTADLQDAQALLQALRTPSMVDAAGQAAVSK
jgi:predicted ATPase